VLSHLVCINFAAWSLKCVLTFPSLGLMLHVQVTPFVYYRLTFLCEATDRGGECSKHEGYVVKVSRTRRDCGCYAHCCQQQFCGRSASLFSRISLLPIVTLLSSMSVSGVCSLSLSLSLCQQPEPFMVRLLPALRVANSLLKVASALGKVVVSMTQRSERAFRILHTIEAQNTLSFRQATSELFS
jgi:hypothetical protein